MLEKNGIAILAPAEYRRLRAVMRARFQKFCDLMLYTGMRYEETLKFINRPNLYQPERRTIFLPREIDRKKKRTAHERYVLLNTNGVLAVERFFMFKEHENPTYPSYIGMDYNLKKWGEKAEFPPMPHVTVRSFRKTWESWLVVSYPERIPVIAMSQGHTTITAMRHYLNLPFTEEEKREILKETEGWG